MRQVKTRTMETGAITGPASGRESEPGWADALAAALDWWRDAGVDCTFVDDPVDWLARAAPAEAAPHSPEEARRAPAAGRAPVSPPPARPAEIAVPDDLDTFRQWWLSEPALDGGRTTGRVPPHGKAGARLMIVVPEPEREDRERLLSGPQGAFLAAMLAAMGLGGDEVYIASALPRHTPMADWSGVAAAGLGTVLARHIALVSPERLLVFGGNILPLLGNAPAQEAAVLRQFNHEGGRIPLLAARELPALLNTPRGNGRLWQAWLDWTATGGPGSPADEGIGTT